MNEPKMPRIRFSEWTPWAQRARLAGTDSPGVYLLAHFAAAPTGAADPGREEIVYIGVTGKTPERTLARRWGQFQRAASRGDGNHRGGRTCFAQFQAVRDDLHVAAFPVSSIPGLQSAFVTVFARYVERRLLWEYVKRWNRLPACNLE